MTETYEDISFSYWRCFGDRAPDDRTVGPARRVEIKGRCADCWNPIIGQRDMSVGRCILIKCPSCGRSVHGEKAERELQRMLTEVENNIPTTRVGGPTVYRKEPVFVLKLLPEMDRDGAQPEQRVTAGNRSAKGRGWLGSNDFPKGTRGILYGQARLLVSALGNGPLDTSPLFRLNYESGESEVVGIGGPNVAGEVQNSGKTPESCQILNESEMLVSMGSLFVAGMVAAFACEVAMKAILMTRHDEAKKTHDLLTLYESLPEDSRKRVEADFAEIADVIRCSRHVFGKWRYFQQGEGRQIISSLTDAIRARDLGKAARVIVDECIVAGLGCDIRVCLTTKQSGDADNVSDWAASVPMNVKVVSLENKIPWDSVLALGRAKPPQ